MKLNKAHVDIFTGKIYGCKKYSFQWYHEQGHLKFNKNPKFSFYKLLDQFIYDLVILAIIGAFFYRPLTTIAIIGWSYHILLLLFEEWWCNEYAYKKIKVYKP